MKNVLAIGTRGRIGSERTRMRRASLRTLMAIGLLWPLGVLGQELALPAVPDTLRTVEARARFVTLHFWDAMDFADTLRSRNTAFMQQNLANFLSVYALADEATQRTAARQLTERSTADSVAYNLLCRLTEQYLYDNESPAYCDAHYVPFAEAQLAMPQWMTPVDRERRTFQLSVARQCLPGSVAPNFRFVTREGKRSTLKKACRRCPTLLLFYDPDCDRCHTLIRRLASNEELNRAIAEGRMAVLAVDAEDDEAAWQRTAHELPANWTVAFDRSQVQERDVYILRTMPLLLHLDTNRRVLQKDPKM